MIQLLKKYKKEFLVLLVILFCAGFVRLYRITDYMHFLGDEGRDVLVVKRMIVDHDPTFLGPITSVGSMYLGPIYYYFMTPFLFIFNMNPVGPAVMIALLSIGSTALLYILGMEFFSLEAGIIASLLYAFSPLVIVHSRSSWNPNAVPFFALLIIYSLLKITVKKELKWALIAGLSLGVILQLHYLALVFIPIIFLVLIIFKKVNLTIISRIIIGTVIMLSPYILFEIFHQFPNIQTALRFITRTGDRATFAVIKFPFKVYDLTLRAFLRLVVIESSLISKVLIAVIIGSLIFIFKSGKKNKFQQPLLILLTWYVITIVLLGLYTGAVYDYYLVQIFPIPALLTGVILSWYFSYLF